MTSKTPTSATSTQGKGSFPAPTQKTSSSPDPLAAMSRPDLTSENVENNKTETTVSFPPPQIFDVLPPLHALLLRLIASQTSTEQQQQQQPATIGPDNGPTAAPTSNNNNNNNNNNNTLAPPPQNTTTSAAQPSDSTATPSQSLKADLDTKSLLTEASTVKIRIQKAKAALTELPDIDRAVEDQEREIENLEAKIGKLKGAIGEFGRRSGGGVGGGGFASGRKLGEDVEMEMGYS